MGKGWNIQQGQCMFLGSNRRNGCEGGKYGGGGYYGDCKGPVADISRCGQGKADTFDQCEREVSTTGVLLKIRTMEPNGSLVGLNSTTTWLDCPCIIQNIKASLQ